MCLTKTALAVSQPTAPQAQIAHSTTIIGLFL